MTTSALSARRSPVRVHPLRGLAWVTWRQHRLALAAVLVTLGSLALVMVLNGLAMHRDFHSLGLDACGALDGRTCQVQLTAFEQDYGGWADDLPPLMMGLPGLIGVFVGAPLVARELESGTFRFAWTLARTRVQWLVTKLTLLAGVLVVFTLPFSLLFTWWYGPFDAISGRMSNGGAYEISGLVFTARTLFAFALGAMLGLLIRRAVPAMAATATAWVAVVVGSMAYLRPLIRQPLTASADVPFNADVTSNWIQSPAGHRVTLKQVISQVRADNAGAMADPKSVHTWMTQHHYTQWAAYRPNSWFWHFQAIEASAYCIVAILLALTTVLVLRRRAV